MTTARAHSGFEAPAAYWDRAARRAHFRHGPIDLSVAADGDARAVRAALSDAWARFQSVLAELVVELPRLRAAMSGEGVALSGSVARRMAAAVAPHAAAHFVTPMAAVAGAVADELLDVMRATPGLSRIAINNGGDVALRLAPGERFALAMQGAGGADLGALTLAAEDLADGAAGVATSGWRGRSFSLGVADSVTVIADSAAAADAAATLIANAVDLPDHPEIRRAPASELAPDSDLGARRVTMAVPDFTPTERRDALAAGLACAEAMRARGLIRSAALFLGGDAVQAGEALGALAQSSRGEAA